MTPAAAAEALIADLADLYGWNVTPTAHLRLLGALRGFTRAEVSKIAADLSRLARGQLTISALIAALQGAQRATEAGAYHRLDPEPDTLDTVGLPVHPLDCECGGAGVVIERDALAIVDPDTGETLSRKRASAAIPCPANGGRRMTRQQHERAALDARLHGAPRAAESWDDARALGLSGVAQARAALNQDPPPTVADPAGAPPQTATDGGQHQGDTP